MKARMPGNPESDDRARACRFLLVEDDESHALMIKVAFDEESGVELEHIRSGDEAIERLSAGDTPDILLLDLRLPGTDGFDVLRAVRTELGLATLPVVVLTTSSADSDFELAKRLGANSYVVKPVGFDAFCDVVRNLRDYWSGVHHLPRSRATKLPA